MKQNRNEACECGSGKKFKNCCMIKSDDSFIRKYSVKIGISIFIILFMWVAIDKINAVSEGQERKEQGPSENQKGWEWCDDCCGWREPGHNANKNN